MADKTIIMPAEDWALLHKALTDLPQNKKIANAFIVRKLIGSGSIWPSEGINKVQGLLSPPSNAKKEQFKQAHEIEGHNFVIGMANVKQSDLDMLFGSESFTTLHAEASMLDVLVAAKIFPSKGQAKKNGWAGKETIPNGWSEFTVGKKKHKIFIWNPNE